MIHANRSGPGGAGVARADGIQAVLVGSHILPDDEHAIAGAKEDVTEGGAAGARQRHRVGPAATAIRGAAEIQRALPAAEADPDHPEAILAIAEEQGARVQVAWNLLGEQAQDLLGFPGLPPVLRSASVDVEDAVASPLVGPDHHQALVAPGDLRRERLPRFVNGRRGLAPRLAAVIGDGDPELLAPGIVAPPPIDHRQLAGRSDGEIRVPRAHTLLRRTDLDELLPRVLGLRKSQEDSAAACSAVALALPEAEDLTLGTGEEPSDELVVGQPEAREPLSPGRGSLGRWRSLRRERATREKQGSRACCHRQTANRGMPTSLHLFSSARTLVIARRTRVKPPLTLGTLAGPRGSIPHTVPETARLFSARA